MEEVARLYYMCHKYSGNTNENVYDSIVKNNKLLDLGYIVYNPILSSHFLHAMKRRPYKFWINFDLQMMNMFDGIILPPNWKESKGCRLEEARARELKIEILMYEDIVNE